MGGSWCCLRPPLLSGFTVFSMYGVLLYLPDAMENIWANFGEDYRAEGAEAVGALVTQVAGGTTAKIMLAAKDNFLGKYIYKDTLARNLAAVIYKDEDEIIDTAKAQYRVLKTENEFRYGYKVVENGNIRSALTTSNVIEVKDFFGDVTAGAKESFAQITGSAVSKEAEEAEGEGEKFRSKRRKKRKSKQSLKTET